jgi:hypothetical protein
MFLIRDKMKLHNHLMIYIKIKYYKIIFIHLKINLLSYHKYKVQK